MNAKVTLPWLITAIGAPASLVPLLVPLRESGSLIPQVFFSPWVQTFSLRKHVWIAGAIGQAACIAAMGLLILTQQGLAAGLALIALVALFSVAKSLTSLSSKDVIAKTIDKDWRGKLGGFSDGVSGIATLAGSIILVTQNTTGYNINQCAYAYFIASVLLLISTAMYYRIDEPSDTSTQNDTDSLQSRIKTCLSSATFRQFLCTRVCLLSSPLAAPFLVMMGSSDKESAFQTLGGFLLANAIANIVAGPIWGYAADLSSRKVMMLASLSSALVCISAAIIAYLELGGAAWIFPSLFLLLTVAHQGIRIGRQTYVINMAEGNQRTEYVAISNSLIGFALLACSGIGLLLLVVPIGLVVAMLSALAMFAILMAYRLPEVE